MNDTTPEPIKFELTNATLTRTKGGGHRLSVGCWDESTS